jgi:hypothetical protein
MGKKSMAAGQMLPTISIAVASLQQFGDTDRPAVTLRPEVEVGPGGLKDGFVMVSGLGPSGARAEWPRSGGAWRVEPLDEFDEHVLEAGVISRVKPEIFSRLSIGWLTEGFDRFNANATEGH